MLKKVTGFKLYKQVVEQIKNMILQGEYKLGDMLPSEKKLMEMTGVSRITVREALKILSEVGVIEVRKGKGSFVLIDDYEIIKKIDGQKKYDEFIRDFEYSLNIRIMLEPEVARQVAMTATDEDIKYIEACLTDPGANSEANSDSTLNVFHRSLFVVMKNKLLLDFFDSLTLLEHAVSKLPSTPPSKQNSTYHKLNNHHYKIFEAIKNRNAEFAYFYMKEHKTFLRQVYSEYFQYFF